MTLSEEIQQFILGIQTQARENAFHPMVLADGIALSDLLHDLALQVESQGAALLATAQAVGTVAAEVTNENG